MSSEGPVLIDWTNAATGPSACDTATTWLVLACLDPPGARARVRLDPVRRPLLRSFLEGVDRTAAAAAMPEVAARRLTDRGTTDPERTRIRALVAAVGTDGDHGRCCPSAIPAAPSA